VFDQANTFLPDMIESMLPRWSDKLALMFRIRMSLDYHGDEVKAAIGLSECCSVEYLVTRPNNYTKVYQREGLFSDFAPGKDLPPWRFVQDHDSGWREAFNTSKVYFDLRDKFIDAGLKHYQISEFIRFDLFQGKPHYVLLENAQAIGKTGRLDHQEKRKADWELELKPIHLHQIHPYLNAYKATVSASKT